MKALILLCLPFALFSSMDLAPALYLMHQGKVEKALTTYQKITTEYHKQDYEVLRQIALMLLEQGAKSNEKEAVLLSMYGAGLSLSSRATEILIKGLKSKDPEVELVALHFLSQMQDEDSDELLTSLAMNSDYLSTRLEACYYMAMRKHPHAVGHAESLMQRLPPFFKPLFPPLFTLMGTKPATSVLKRLLNDSNPHVRVRAIMSIVQFGRDDLLAQVRKKASLKNVAELEAAIFALGMFKDKMSLPYLKKLADHSNDHVRLAALKALYHLGETHVRQKIEVMALSHNPFAIDALKEIKGSSDILFELTKSKHCQTRINAAIGLLKQRDPRCLPYLKEILIQDLRGLSFQYQHSIGGAHSALKVISSANQKKDDPFVHLGISLNIREEILRDAMHLKNEAFIPLAKMIFDAKQSDLVPLAMRLLENLQTEKAKELLKKEAEEIGSPFVRDFANLILFKLQEEGPYEKRVLSWLKGRTKSDQIQLRQHIKYEDRQDLNGYSMSAEEKSQLLLDTFATLLSRQDEESLSIALDAMKKGNPLNRFALAGLMMRASE